MNSELIIDLTNLKVGWDKTGREPFRCAGCGELIDTETPDPETGDTEVPLQLFRGKGKNTEMLSFHLRCGEKRISASDVMEGAE